MVLPILAILLLLSSGPSHALVNVIETSAGPSKYATQLKRGDYKPFL